MSPAGTANPGKSCGQPVSRILSLFRGDDHSSRPAVTDRVWLPTRTPDRSAPVEGPYLALLPVGLAVPRLLPGPRCAFTAPFHPCRPVGRRSVLCGAFPRVAPAGRYPAPPLRGVRTFLGGPRARAVIRLSAKEEIVAQGARVKGAQSDWIGREGTRRAVRSVTSAGYWRARPLIIASSATERGPLASGRNRCRKASSTRAWPRCTG